MIIDKYSNWGHIKYFLAQLVYIIIPFILYFFTDTENGLLLYVFMFLLLNLLYFFNKKQFQVYAVKFDDEQKIVIVDQFKYLIKRRTNIKYEDFSSDFTKVNFGYSIMTTLILKDNSKIVAMIGVKNWFNWKEEELKSIKNYLSPITSNTQ